jgi:hypothetical protein
MRAADAELAKAAAAQHGVFAHAQCRALGLTTAHIRQRVHRGVWIRVYDRAYRIAGAPVTWKGELLAACWAGGFRAAASHRSAAALWGLAGGRRSVTEITCPRWRRAQHDGFVVHEIKGVGPMDLTEVDGVPVTAPDLTLLHLGAVCHESIVELALDAAERRGLVTNTSLQHTLDRLGKRGRNGAGVLRRLLDARGPRRATPESEMETLLFQAMRRAGLPEPVPQHEVRLGGVFVARVDAAYPELRVAIEYDSSEHHGSRVALIRDSARRNRLFAAGWVPITATKQDLRDGGIELCAAISEIRRRAS